MSSSQSTHVGTTMLYGLLVTGQSLIVGRRMRHHTSALMYSIATKVAEGVLPNELVDRIHAHLMDLKHAEADAIFAKHGWVDAVAKFDDAAAMQSLATSEDNVSAVDRNVRLIWTALTLLQSSGEPHVHWTYGSEWLSLHTHGPDPDTGPIVYLTISRGAHGIGLTQMGAHINTGGGSKNDRGRWRLSKKNGRKASGVVSGYITKKRKSSSAGANQQVFHDVDGIMETLGLWDQKMAENEVKDMRLELVASRENADATKPSLRLIQGFCRRG
ncbi:hypothetical protein LTS18_003326 [Coniosporium uncinatum]|uniref:Uncharacterized protein n=1 Tax=Coniosporium uncinatum TaxID=93489 RepID=A0ACC3DBK8_9PEZI|nr:hypothetical protein LTS18_003326 [Coniosporium uncinatum]